MATYNKSTLQFNWTATADLILERLRSLSSQVSGTEVCETANGE
jgi:hypothetical protein